MSPKSRGAAKAPAAPRPWPRRLLLLAGIAVAGAGLILTVENQIASPDIKLLIPERGAHWIRHRRPFKLVAWGPTQEVVFFRKRVTVPPPGGPRLLTVQALRTCMVYCDRQRIFASIKPEEWKQPHQITLQNFAPGEHTIEIFVENSFGPAALLVYCDALDLRSGEDWEEHVLGDNWQSAATVDDVEPPELARRLDSPIRALALSLYWLGPLFLAVWGGLIWTDRRAGIGGTPTWWSASRCRWIVLAAWFVLAANNFIKLPPNLGYDFAAHLDYIRFIADRGEIPDARDGLQMFQAPLFYAISAVLYRFLTMFFSTGNAILWLRWLPLLCGAAQVEICFRVGRCVFPDRDDLQSLTVLLGGLLPMNLYMSQTLGNEPLCGVLSALVLLWSWRALRQPTFARQSRWQWGLGLIFGLSLLTKVSVILLAPLIAVVLSVTNRQRGFVGILTAFARSFGTAAIVSGWYYARNWFLFGKLFVGGWDPIRGLLWWQDPGYRTPWQMATFGRSLFQPIHAGFYSIWDGFYSTLWLDGNLSAVNTNESLPPWNYASLLASPWPALLLSAAVFAGLLRGLRCRDVGLRHALQLAGGSLLLYLTAFVLLALEVPAFSQAKASYTLGLTPAYAVLGAAGLDLLPPNRLLRTAALAFVLCWSVLAYGAYFVL
jgi:hypothetical protein